MDKYECKVMENPRINEKQYGFAVLKGYRVEDAFSEEKLQHLICLLLANAYLPTKNAKAIQAKESGRVNKRCFVVLFCFFFQDLFVVCVFLNFNKFLLSIAIYLFIILLLLFSCAHPFCDFFFFIFTKILIFIYLFYLYFIYYLLTVINSLNKQCHFQSFVCFLFYFYSVFLFQ